MTIDIMEFKNKINEEPPNNRKKQLLEDQEMFALYYCNKHEWRKMFFSHIML